MKELKQYSIKTNFSTYQNISAIYIYFPNSADQLNNSMLFFLVMNTFVSNYGMKRIHDYELWLICSIHLSSVTSPEKFIR